MKTKKKDVLNRFLPLWAIPPLVTILAVNCLIYWGSSALTASRYHYDFTMAFDRAVPLLPGFVWIYILAFPFWAAGYMLAARRGKDMFYRFVATDLTIHLICFLIFILVPTNLNEEAKEALRKFDEACGNRPKEKGSDDFEKPEKKKKSFMDKLKETFED